MLLSEDYVVWDKYLDLGDVDEVGGELASLGELDKYNISILPHIVVTNNAFSYFLEYGSLHLKIKHLLGTLNHAQHESLSQVSNHIKNLLNKSHIPEKISNPIHKMIDALGIELFTLRAFYFDKKKLLFIKENRDVKGDAVILENIRRAWSDMYSKESLERYMVGPHNHHNLRCVIAVIPMYEFVLTGHVSHANKLEYEIEAYSMTRYKYNKHTKKIVSAFVLPGGNKDSLSVFEIKKLLDIGQTAERLFYFHQTVYWGKYGNEILVTRVVPRVADEQNTFSSLIDTFTIHPGITVGKLRIVNEKKHEAIEFNNEIVVLEKLDKKMIDSLKKVKGIIIKDMPHPEVAQIIRQLGIPTVVRKNDNFIYSTGDVISFNATTGEIKRGNMLVS